jgi:CSLREA domain-containing protein
MEPLRRESRVILAAALMLAALACPPPLMAAVFTVNSTLDSDDTTCSALSSSNPSLECTLREAINAANASADADTIGFAIPGGGVRTIRPLSALPIVERDVLIDGYTQPGSTPNTLVNGDNAVLRIELDGSLAGLSTTGLWLGAHNTVRGLIINRFGGTAVFLHGTWDSYVQAVVAENVVEGNFIGTDVSGTLRRPNGAGVVMDSAENEVGGGTPSARNLISGNDGTGVGVSASSYVPAWDNAIAGNFIGTTATGTARLPNAGNGVFLSAGARMNPVTGNVISGNFGDGIDVYNFTPTAGNFLISGNKIGTDVTGTLNLGNGGSGVQIGGADYVDVIGNTIAFNGLYGVEVAESIGVHIRFNSIFSNFELGIDLKGGEPSGEQYGVTPNDLGDGDGGPNYQQNHPVVTAAVSGGGTTTISGRLHSTPRIPFWIEVLSNPACDASGYGEGRTLVGRFKVVTDFHGNVPFTQTFATATPVGSAITATATTANDPVYAEYNPRVAWLSGDTSEFSPCLTVGPRVVIPIILIADARIIEDERGLTAVYVLTLSEATEDLVTVDYATVDGKAVADVDYEPQEGTITFKPGETDKQIAIRLLTDTARDPEAFAVKLANAMNATIAQQDHH